jgi:hypothetical protein
MRSVRDYNSNWSGGTPELSTTSWNLLALPAAVLVVMAVLQIISFGKFKDWLDQIHIGAPAVVTSSDAGHAPLYRCFVSCFG